MIAWPSPFVFASIVVFALLVGCGAYYLRRMRSATNATWQSLIDRLVAVDRGNIELIALDLVDEFGQPRKFGQTGIEPEGMWDLVGGLDGLERLEKNCEVLVDLAFYVQRWHPEAVVVAEQLRLSAREIQWHVDRLRGAAQTGNLTSSFPQYAQRAVATYYLMTRHLLELYELVNLAELGELKAVL